MKAMILAAGRGERLRPLTDTTPKPLLEAGGRPLIVRMIEQLVAAGMTDLVINLGYRGRQIQETLGGGDAWGARIVYSREPEAALDTGGGIFKALPHLSDPCLVVNGDVATDFPFAELPRNPRGLAHLVLVPNPPHHPGGDFALREGRVLPSGVSEPTYTFSGIGIYSHALFCHCRPGRFALAPLLRRGIAEGSVSGQLYRGFWSDIGTPERLKAWDRELKRRGGEP